MHEHIRRFMVNTRARQVELAAGAAYGMSVAFLIFFGYLVGLVFWGYGIFAESAWAWKFGATVSIFSAMIEVAAFRRLACNIATALFALMGIKTRPGDRVRIVEIQDDNAETN